MQSLTDISVEGEAAMIIDGQREQSFFVCGWESENEAKREARMNGIFTEWEMKLRNG